MHTYIYTVSLCLVFSDVIDKESYCTVINYVALLGTLYGDES